MNRPMARMKSLDDPKPKKAPPKKCEAFVAFHDQVRRATPEGKPCHFNAKPPSAFCVIHKRQTDRAMALLKSNGLIKTFIKVS